MDGFAHGGEVRSREGFEGVSRAGAEVRAKTTKGVMAAELAAERGFEVPW